MIDKRMKPWLLEVNHSPSLLCESPFDKELKDSLITGAMKIMDFDPSFKKKTIAYERARTMRRISGQGDCDSQCTKLWSAGRESEIAAATQWRLIYPIPSKPELQQTYDEVMAAIQRLPIDGAAETTACLRRREAIQSALQEKEKKQEEAPKKTKQVAPATPPRPLLVSRTPRSQLLLREAKLLKLRAEAKREQAARLQGEAPPVAQIPAKGSVTRFPKLPGFAAHELVFGVDP
jgi:tubulin polyglutamylase TTLL6/13